MGPALYGSTVSNTVCKENQTYTAGRRLSSGSPTGPVGSQRPRQRRRCRRRSASATPTKTHVAARAGGAVPAAAQRHPDFGGGGGIAASGEPASDPVPASSSAPEQTSLVQIACEATSVHASAQ